MLPPANPQTDAVVDPKEGLNIKKAQIQLLEAELSDVDAKLDAEFIDGIQNLLSDEEMELRLDDDIRPFVSMIEEKREAFYREKLDELKSRINGMKGEVEEEEEGISIEEAKKAFFEAHPDVDFVAFSNFFHKHTTPAEKDDLYATSDYLDMLEKAYTMYSKKNKPAKKEEASSPEANLPPDLNSAPSSAPVGDPSPVAKNDEYMRRAGFRR